MEPNVLIDTMRLLEKLKNTMRHSWTSAGRRESVAEHSWRLALLAVFVGDEFPNADICRLVRMCLLHDIGEAYTGDIPAFEKTEDDESTEDAAVRLFLSGLPEPYREEWSSLFAEMKAQLTLDAKIFRALDKLEAVLQHNEADISTWLPLEYDLQLTYGAAEADFSDYMRRLRQAAREDTLALIENSKNG
jgi:putative hydrolase of HD superfamily